MIKDGDMIAANTPTWYDKLKQHFRLGIIYSWTLMTQLLGIYAGPAPPKHSAVILGMFIVIIRVLDLFQLH